MIEIRKAADRGHANHGWLNSAHTFSFAQYFDAKQIGFSDLLVINEDSVDPNKGFGQHPHNNMEIFSYVLKGALAHKDSMGNGATIYPGDIQLMSAGSGITHSEINGSTIDPVHFLQIWIVPNIKNISPKYQQIHVTEEDKRANLRLIISPDGRENSLKIHQDSAVYAGIFDQDDDYRFNLNPERYYYLHVATGSIFVNGIAFSAGDGARIRNETSLHFTDADGAELLLFDLRPNEYPDR